MIDDFFAVFFYLASGVWLNFQRSISGKREHMIDVHDITNEYE